MKTPKSNTVAQPCYSEQRLFPGIGVYNNKADGAADQAYSGPSREVLHVSKQNQARQSFAVTHSVSGHNSARASAGPHGAGTKRLQRPGAPGRPRQWL